jgi:Uncharacterized conserved protein
MKGIIDISRQRVIGSAGQVKKWDGEVLFPETRSYKILFTLNNLDSAAEGIQPAVDKIARAINLYALASISLDHLAVVVLVAGAAVELFNTEHSVYEKNQAVLQELIDAGVSFMICSQALAGKGIAATSLPPFVDIALSAMTASVELQTQGYAVLTL